MARGDGRVWEKKKHDLVHLHRYGGRETNIVASISQ